MRSVEDHLKGLSNNFQRIQNPFGVRIIGQSLSVVIQIAIFLGNGVNVVVRLTSNG